jgi:hypothetical protein
MGISLKLAPPIRREAMAKEYQLVIPISVFLFVATFLFYLATFNPMGAGDGPTWLRHAMSGDIQRLFPLQHLLHNPFLYGYLHLVTFGSAEPLASHNYFELVRLAQIPFAIFAAVGVVLLFKVVSKFTNQPKLALVASLLLLFSAGYWFNANLETKIYTVTMWLATFELCLNYNPGRYRQLILIGVVGAITTLCEIDAMIASLMVAYFILTKNRGRLIRGIEASRKSAWWRPFGLACWRSRLGASACSCLASTSGCLRSQPAAKP